MRPRAEDRRAKSELNLTTTSGPKRLGAAEAAAQGDARRRGGRRVKGARATKHSMAA